MKLRETVQWIYKKSKPCHVQPYHQKNQRLAAPRGSSEQLLED